MNRRIATRVVDTGRAVSNTLINQDASEVYWITVSPHDVGENCIIQIYDGFDAGGKLVWQARLWYNRHFNFIPPIHCEQGVFVYTNNEVEFYTIAWRPKKWDRPKPMKADVIEHPEA